MQRAQMRYRSGSPRLLAATGSWVRILRSSSLETGPRARYLDWLREELERRGLRARPENHPRLHAVNGWSPSISARSPTLTAGPPGIAQVLGVRETGRSSLERQVTDALREEPTLLVLDNFEQVIEAGPLLARLWRLPCASGSRQEEAAAAHLCEYAFEVPRP